MKKSATSNFDLSSFSKLSDQVFDLEREYKLILKAIALRGPSNLASITRFTEHAEPPIYRWVIRKKIDGNTRTMGLISSEYVYDVEEDKHRYGKQEKTYYLTTKGLLASLSVGVRLEKIDLYKKFMDFLNNKIDDKEIRDFVKDHIKNQIHFFLVWHAVNGIQLTKQLGSRHYLTQFLLFRDKLIDFNQFPVNMTDKRIESKCLEIKRQYLTSQQVFFCLIEHDYLPNPLLRPVELGPNVDISGNKYKVEGKLSYIITQWPIFLEQLQKLNFDESKIEFEKMLEPKKTIDRINELDVYKKVVQTLKKMGKSTAIPQVYLEYINRKKLRR